MSVLSILGTTSDSGKSTITMALSKIIHDRGISVSPFKAQNMSNNSAVCDDGSEIGRAQYLQAECINIPTSYRLNPILLKPQGKGYSQLVLNGRVYETIHARDYFQKMDFLKPFVDDAINYLLSNYKLVIAEGAGSPVELNLMNRDLSNIYVAERFNSKIILVADIERGGVFASIYGTYHLLPESLKSNVIGVIINKFRGDIQLFGKGIEIIEKDFGLKVLGVIPYQPINIDMEDSLSIRNYSQKNKDIKIRGAIIRLPHISNYNDMDPLILDEEIHIDWINNYQNLQSYDFILIPGSKCTIKDYIWLKEIGLADEILKQSSKMKIGICGGYQMMFEKLSDPDCIENDKPVELDGLSYVPGKVTFQKNKILRRRKYNLFHYNLRGYEIHCGITDSQLELGYREENILGTHIHGIFENNEFRRDIFKAINPNYKGNWSYQELKIEKLQLFIDLVEKSLDMKYILSKVVDH